MDSIHHRPWSAFAGVMCVAMGTTLLSPLSAGAVVPLTASVGALVVGAILELASGFELDREGGAWMAQVVSGGVILFFGTFLLGLPPLVDSVFSPAPLALMLGLACAVNALFRLGDLWGDHPRAALTEAIDVAVTFTVAAILFIWWRHATLWLIARAAGAELCAGGVAILGASLAAYRRPQLVPYEDRQEQLRHMH